MIKNLSNERGAALVLVLLAILLVAIFGTVLTSQIISTGVQTNKSQELVQAESLAVMGQELINEDVERIVSEELDVDEVWGDRNYEKNVTESSSYMISTSEFEDLDDGGRRLPYTVTGRSGNTEKVIEGIISFSSGSKDWIQDILDQKQVIESTCPSNGPSECYYEEYQFKKNDGQDYRGDVWFERGVDVKGSRDIEIDGFWLVSSGSLQFSGNSTVLTVKGDAYIGDVSLSLSGNGKKSPELIFEKDVYFAEPINSSILQHAGIFCVKGKTNLEGARACN
ncbi:hypothetical protein LCM20_04920 [Halobacillus litoralis]|uniref:hypothetical protein n=1 Tax=Halobacillus litoralis TaxID=45668 RepID=UPI001CD46784|nr:hypothetical protein [Halobacillus litoralis]MCA0969921.1 hypothetical protein [Halobacillus litoralis]